MPRNGSGVYSAPAGTTAVPNTVIESADFNSVVTDLGQALTDSVNVDGTAPWEANQPMGGFKLTGLGAGTAAADSARLAQVQSDIHAQATVVGGTVDAINLTFSPVFTAYTSAMRIRWVSGGVNTVTNPTANVDTTGAKTIKKGASAALAVGDLGASGYICEAVYNGTDLILLNPATGLGAGKMALWIPATALISRTTNGAAVGAVEMATNKQMVRTIDYDTTTQEFGQVFIRMPKAWDEGTVSFIPVWSHAATVTNFGVVFALEAVAVADDGAMDVAWGTAQTSTDTGGTTNDVYIGPESSAITISGSPTAGCGVFYQLKRVPSDGSDTLAVDARLHGFALLYTVASNTEG